MTRMSHPLLNLRPAAVPLQPSLAPAGPAVAPAGVGLDRRADPRSSICLRGSDGASDVWTPRSADQGVAAGSGEPAADQAAGPRPRPSAAAPAVMPWTAKLYVGAVIAAGAALVALQFPRTFPDPAMSAGLLALIVVASALKVSLPIAGTSATMSVSFVGDFMAVLLVGPAQAAVFAAIGALAQCVANRTPPNRLRLHRVVFSMSALAITVQVTALAYAWLGGRPGLLDPHDLVKPIVAGSFAYFFCNTILVATAGALATGQSPYRVWRESFLWSAPSFFVGGAVAIAATSLIQRGEIWFAPMVAAPVYLTYLTYKVYLGRIQDEQRHVEAVSALHAQAMQALAHAQRSELALAIERERLVVTLGTIGEAVIASDTRGRIVLLNHTAEVFTGWSQAEAIGAPIMDVLRLITPGSGQTCSSPVDRVLRTQASVARDQRAALVARDGTPRLVEHSAMPVRDVDGAIVAVVVVVRDMTDAIRLEEERLQASKLASLGVLAGGIAHDFNNILTAIAGNLSLAQLDDASAAQRRSIDEAEKGCQRAKALTQQLLTFSKGGKPLKKTIDLGPAIEEAAGFALRGSNVTYLCSLAGDLRPVDADEGQIVQVITNLVLNAAQSMPDGGQIEVRGENAVVDGRPHVSIVVEDRGTGIPEEHLPRIFDPYFTTKQAGSGLGLATCYSIVHNHDGQIAVHSTPGRGTTMIVTLPAAAGRAVGPAERPDGPPARGKGRVLVMDDEEPIRDVVRAMLVRLGYRVEVAADGRAALAAYQAAHFAGDAFDTVIMDLTVPGGMGGKEAVKALLAFDPHVTAIVSSGYADDPVMADYQRYGFKGVVPKPFTVKDLSRVLQQLVH